MLHGCENRGHGRSNRRAIALFAFARLCSFADPRSRIRVDASTFLTSARLACSVCRFYDRHRVTPSLRCARCNAEGAAVSVTAADTIVVSYVCSRCGHDWVIERRPPPLPRVTRRKRTRD
jgi:hypothetical protein